MYYAHFGLTRPPFRITPDTTLFFSGAERGSVLEALTYVVMTGEGITKVIGEVGSGKTMLCRMLEEKLPDNVETVYIANPNIEPDKILHVIAFEAGLTAQSENRFELMQLLQKWLLDCHAKGQRVVVLIEEAQGMPIDTLEEIRLLSNLETNEDKLLQIVLFGQPELDEKLARTEIRQLQDRIAHNFYLNPLTRDQIRDYANFRMRQAGYHGPDIFDDRVCRVLTSRSKGLIRRVNILADKTLLAAFSIGTTKLTAQHAYIAARDSHFTDTFKSSNRLWLLVSGAAVAGFMLAMIGVWLFWPGQTNVIAMGEQPDRVSVTQPPMVPDRHNQPSNPDIMRENGAADVHGGLMPGTKGTSTKRLAALETAERGLSNRDEKTHKGAIESDTAAKVSEGFGVNHGQTTVANIESNAEELEQAAIAVLAQSLLEDRLAVTRRWFQGAKSNLYSIQLMMVKAQAADNLNAYLKQLPSTIDINDIFIYETEISGNTMLGVLYQEFESRDAALTRMNDMPATFKKIKPFLLRSLQGLRREIADSNG